MPYIHSLLSKIPDDLPFEMLIVRAGDLFIQFPPEQIEIEAEQDAKRYRFNLSFTNKINLNYYFCELCNFCYNNFIKKNYLEVNLIA